MDIFAHPSNLWFLIGAAALAAAVLWWIPAKREALMRTLIQKNSLLERLAGNPEDDRRPVKAWMISAGCLAAVLALAGPQWGLKTEEVPQLSGNLLIAMDVSDSMLAEDVKPNRLERAKFELMDAYVKKSKGQAFRIGLVTFAGRAYLQCPLTLDAGALRYILETVTAGSLPYAGTSISSALKVSQTVLKQAAGAKHVLIVTDGEDHEGKVQAAAQDLAKTGVKISALWVGSEAGEPIPLRDENGNFLGYKKDRQDQTVLSKAKGDSLEAACRLTGGRFIRLSGSTDIQGELKSLVSGSAQGKGKEKRVSLENRFQYPLALGFLLLLAEMAVPERKRRKNEKT